LCFFPLPLPDGSMIWLRTGPVDPVVPLLFLLNPKKPFPPTNPLLYSVFSLPPKAWSLRGLLAEPLCVSWSLFFLFFSSFSLPMTPKCEPGNFSTEPRCLVKLLPLPATLPLAPQFFFLSGANLPSYSFSPRDCFFSLPSPSPCRSAYVSPRISLELFLQMLNRSDTSLGSCYPFFVEDSDPTLSSFFFYWTLGLGGHYQGVCDCLFHFPQCEAPIFFRRVDLQVTSFCGKPLLRRAEEGHSFGQIGGFPHFGIPTAFLGFLGDYVSPGSPLTAFLGSEQKILVFILGFSFFLEEIFFSGDPLQSKFCHSREPVPRCDPLPRSLLCNFSCLQGRGL